MTTMTITNAQIQTLSDEADAAGDLAMVVLCDRALHMGDDAARAECADVIAEAAAQDDSRN